MSEQKTVALDCDQYEDFKEDFIKAFKAEIVKMQNGGDNTAVVQRIDEIAQTTKLSTEQITNFINRIGQIEFQPVIAVQPPDMTDINRAFGKINISTAILAEAMKLINAEMKTALSDEKIKKAVQLFVSREAEKYKEMLDGHWTHIDNTLDHLLQRIPYNYDINKRLVKAGI